MAKAAYVEKVFSHHETQNRGKVAVKGECRGGGSGTKHITFLTQMLPRCRQLFHPLFLAIHDVSSWGFQSDAVHALETLLHPDVLTAVACGTSESVEQHLGKRCESKEGGGGEMARHQTKKEQWFWEVVEWEKRKVMKMKTNRVSITIASLGGFSSVG